MLGIFEDDRRRNRPISPNPYGTGWIFPPAALRLLELGPASPAQARLAGRKIHRRRPHAVSANRA